MRYLSLAALPLFLAALLPTAAPAQIAVSANDNKAVLDNGVTKVPPNPAPDTVAIISPLRRRSSSPRSRPRRASSARPAASRSRPTRAMRS